MKVKFDFYLQKVKQSDDLFNNWSICRHRVHDNNTEKLVTCSDIMCYLTGKLERPGFHGTFFVSNDVVSLLDSMQSLKFVGFYSTK